MSVQSIKGFADLFAPQSTKYSFMEQKAREIFWRFGYDELRTPIMEFTDLFCRSIGTETDVVQKEMYTFADRKERSLTLRPEATAGVMRAFIQAKRHNTETVSKFFTTGPMFRYERPQKGRMRQFHQINCECLGASHARTDAEVIIMLVEFLKSIGIQDFEVQLNSLGCTECRPQYRNILTQYLRELDSNVLCEDCRRRMETNPLRVLDCKVPSCKEHTENAPKFSEHICQDCSSSFESVLHILNIKNVNVVLNARLVRGLDYYCRTTFEVVSSGIGAQTSIAGGGRYDGLVKQLGGPDVSGIGFACGMERLAMLMPDAPLPPKHFYIVFADNDAASTRALTIACDLRDAGFCGDISHSGGSFKSQMRQAGKSNASYAIIIGDDEMEQNTVSVKNMESGHQENVALSDVISFFNSNVNKSHG